MTSVAMADQLAGKGAARAARRRKHRMEGGFRRPGWLTYLLLSVFIVISAAPLYYAFLLATSTAADIAQNPLPSIVPQGHLAENIGRVLDAGIGFWQALMNSVIVAVITSLAVIFFSTLAGYSFAKLRFRGRNGLLAFVIGTMAVPTQLGIIPLFIVMAKLGWAGQRNLGRSAAVAWLLFLIIVIFALINYAITRRIASSDVRHARKAVTR